MTKKTRRRSIDAKTKAKIAISAIKGELTLAEISSEYQVHSTQVSKWKKTALQELPSLFVDGRRSGSTATDEKLLSSLYEEIGRLKVELDWLKKKLDRFQ